MTQPTALHEAPLAPNTLPSPGRFYLTRKVSESGHSFTLRELSAPDFQAWQTQLTSQASDDISSMISLLSFVLYDAENEHQIHESFVRELPLRLIKRWSDIVLEMSGFAQSPEQQKKSSPQTTSD